MKPDEIKRYYSTDDMLEVGARQLNFGPRDEYVLAADHDRVVAALAERLRTATSYLRGICDDGFVGQGTINAIDAWLQREGST